MGLIGYDDLDEAEREIFTTITADPPWLERGGGKIKRGADRHYELMKTVDIIDLMVNRCPPLRLVNRERSAMFIWVTNNFLEDGLRLMRELGYRYITNLVWGKTRMGLGYYFHGQHELVLFGVKGRWPRPPKVSGMNSTLLGAELLPHPKDPETGKIIHSKKPVELAEMIEARFPPGYLELFARKPRPGWEAWGNEIEGAELPGSQILLG